MVRQLIASLVLLAAMSPARADERADLQAALQKIADDYIASSSEAEHSSAISISLSLPEETSTVNAVAGVVSRDPGAAPITAGTLFQIGSITKSMTAAALLQLQTEGRLDLDDPLGKYLPEYPAWKDVPIRRLLNMTSGIPTYDSSMFGDIVTYGNSRHFSPPVLVGFVDPSYPGAPAATKGYDYSNTNYILAGMILSKLTGKPVAEVFAERLLGPKTGLTDTHYVEGIYPPEILARMPSGYAWQPDDPDFKAISGEDFRAQDMSWAGSAGAAVATPEQVARWVRALYQSDLLTDEARAELLDVVSMKTGAAIGKPSKEDPSGFGLGVTGFASDALGSGWEYEGGSMGFRVVYLYLPERDLVAVVGINSNIDSDKDHIGKIAVAVLQAAMK
jgi:D-alanyl-D-alanine carboxypeptidase